MEKFVVSQNSWHFKFIKYMVPSVTEYNMPNDFCSYWRAFMKACIMSVAIVLFIVVMVSFAGILVFGFVTNPATVTMAIASILLITGFIVGLGYLLDTYSERVRDYFFAPIGKAIAFVWNWSIGIILNPVFRFIEKKIDEAIDRRNKRSYNKRKKEKKPSLFMQKYKAFKERYCPMVTYE